MVHLSKIELACVNGDSRQPASTKAYYCPNCYGTIMPVYQFDGIKKENISEGPPNIFRYGFMLPVETQPNEDSPLHRVGLTRLLRADELAELVGIDKGRLYLKFDGDMISGTFKDRGVVVVDQLVEELNSEGENHIAYGATSTGNLASAVAAAASLKGRKSIILVHESAEDSLVKKALSYGAYAVKVMHNYSAVTDRLREVLEDNPMLANQIAWVNLNFRPFYSQGSKTIGPEIAEQLGWQAPHNIVYPVAAGLSLWQIYHGLMEFKQIGLVKELPTRMHAVQTQACDPIVDAWKRGEPFNIIPQKPRYKSLAETLSVGNPGNGYEVLSTLKRSNGSAVSVSEKDIEFGIKLVNESATNPQFRRWKTGTVGGATVAGLRERVKSGAIRPDELTVVVLTDGFNDIRDYEGSYTDGKHDRYFEIEPDRKIIAATLEKILAA